MKKKYLRLDELIELIDDPNRQYCTDLYNDYAPQFITAPGSLAKHQAWEGGYLHHVEETMNIAVDLYTLYKKNRGYKFSLSDALVVLFLHDIEKLFKYTGLRNDLDSEEQKWLFLEEITKKYHFKLMPNHWNGLCYIHGEGDDYHRTERIQSELAGFCHICDVFSARVFHDQPKH